MFEWVLKTFLVRYKKQAWFKFSAVAVMGVVGGLEFAITNGSVSGTSEWLVRTIQVAAIAKGFLSQIDWELPVNGPEVPDNWKAGQN